MGKQERTSNDAEIVIEQPGKKETRRRSVDWMAKATPKELEDSNQTSLQTMLDDFKGWGGKKE